MRAEVDVWQASLRASDEQLRSMCALLTAEETLHMSALRTATLRRRFAAGRAFLRSVLAGYLDVAPERVAFERGPAGKPRLADRIGGAALLEFNLSHAREHALCAAARGVVVGVDLEWVDPRVDPDEVAACCFAPYERDELHRLAPGRRPRAFFTAWTRKEAVVKALGSGLSTPLSGFAVPVGPDDPPRVTWHVPPFPEGPWTLVDLAAPAGYVACLAAHATEVDVRRREWGVSPPDAEPSAA